MSDHAHLFSIGKPTEKAYFSIFFQIFWGLVPGFVSLVLGIVRRVLGFVSWVLGFVFWVSGFVSWQAASGDSQFLPDT